MLNFFKSQYNALDELERKNKRKTIYYQRAHISKCHCLGPDTRNHNEGAESCPAIMSKSGFKKCIRLEIILHKGKINK
jgi:hypothetical protein